LHPRDDVGEACEVDGEERQNVTIVLPARILKRARPEAVDVSLSAYLSQLIEGNLAQRTRFDAARRGR
jgi:hypothetical protein